MLETERLLIRKPVVEDDAFMLRLVNEPSWLQYIGDRNVHTLEEARQYLLNGSMKSFELYGFGFGIVILKENGESIGMSGLVKRDFLEDVDIGFAFFPEYTGKGYALESAVAVRDFAFGELALERLAAITTQDNASSIRLLQKLGFVVKEKIWNQGEELFLFSALRTAKTSLP
jgi:RimJ/RimL family protein N-acetyltransferase